MDLKKLIARIPDDLPIPNLKHKLVNILSDCHVQVTPLRPPPSALHVHDLSLTLDMLLCCGWLQVAVRRGCNAVLKRDCQSLSARLHGVRRAAVKVNVDRTVRCGICEGSVFVGKIEPVVSFFCQHTFHASCIGTTTQPLTLLPRSHSPPNPLPLFCAVVVCGVWRGVAEGQRVDRKSAPQCPRCTNRYAHGPALAPALPPKAGAAKPDSKSAASEVAPLRMGGKARAGAATASTPSAASAAGKAGAATSSASSSTPSSKQQTLSKQPSDAKGLGTGSAPIARATSAREFDVSRMMSELKSAADSKKK